MSRYSIQSDAADIDLIRVAHRLWIKKWLILTFMAIGGLLAIIYLHEATPTYTAALRVTPAASSATGGSSKLGGLGGLAAMAGLPSLSGGGATPFELYIDALQSRAVADRLAQEPQLMHHAFAAEWDNANGKWHEPGGASRNWGTAIKSLLGFPKKPWHAPDGARLQDYIKSSLEIIQDPKVPITRLQLDDRDPGFAQHVLSRLNAEADNQVRSRALAQATRYAQFLSTKLAQTVVAEHRMTLSASLGEQERMVMMASSGAPYAANPLESAYASESPTRPKGGMVLAAGFVGFGLVGVFFALLDLLDIGRAITARSIQKSAPPTI